MNDQTDEKKEKEQKLASKELKLIRKEVELTEKEAELAHWEADRTESETEQIRKDKAQAKEEAQKAENEKKRSQEELGRIRREIEAAEAKKQAVLAEIEAAEKKARAAEAEMEAKQAEAEKQARDQKAKEKQAKLEREKQKKPAQKEEGKEKKKQNKAADDESRREARRGKGREADRQKKRSQADEEDRQRRSEKSHYEEQSLKDEKSKKDTEKQSKNQDKIKQMSVDDALDHFSSDPKQGLSEDEAKKRLEKYGKNKIEEEKKSPILKFLSYFWGPIPFMLEAAIILGAVVQRWEEFGVMLTMLLINVGVSFWHDREAENAIAALKEQLAPEATVVRGGEKKTIDAEDLVPGDIIQAKMGQVVPADAKLLHGQHVNVDESSLTGESLPVDKQEGDLIFSGTSVKRGKAKALVTATGNDSRFARTVDLVEDAGKSTHFQKAVIRIGYFLIAIVVVLIAIILGVGLWRGDPVIELIMFSLVLVVAGIPVALPAVLTVTMAVGAKRLAKMKAIVSHLPAMEEMAGLKVLCADKTGTLTQNRLALQEPVLLAAEDKKDLILLAALTCEQEDPDPIDQAILEALENKERLEEYEISDFKSFDPTRKRAEARVEHNGKSFSVAKGAPQSILELVEADNKLKKDVSEKVDKLGQDGFRALGVACKKDGGWDYMGILSLLDPPREDAAEVMHKAANYGIDVRMVTGDHAAIAKQVAKQVGLSQEIIEADEYLDEDTGHASAKNHQKIISAAGFAQVTPEHKFNIVKHFQQDDLIVGMTGDGVNDAPALKQADVGIAVSGATDAARAAADLVLTKPGLDVITHAVEEARRIFWRMTGYSIYRITETMRVVFFLTLAILLFNSYPINAVMVALLAILNDIPILTIALDNARTAKKPVRWDMRAVLSISTVLSIYGVAISFLLYWFVKTQTNLPHETIQTIMFLKLLVDGHTTIYVSRSRSWLWRKPWPNINFFLALEGTQVIGTLAAVYGFLMEPIGWLYAGYIWAYTLSTILLVDAAKMLTYKILEKTGK